MPPVDEVAGADGAPAVGPDPSAVAEGTERVLLFRGALRVGHRSAGGLVDIFYGGDVLESLDAMERHALRAHGPGRYRVVVQRMTLGGWQYLTSTVVAVGSDPLED